MGLTVNEIFLKLSALALKNDIELKYSHKVFFVDLLRLIETSGVYDPSCDMKYIELPVSALCKEFKLSTHIVQSAISTLDECGIIKKVQSGRSFKKLGKDNYVRNKPNRIYVNEKLLKEIDYEEFF